MERIREHPRSGERSLWLYQRAWIVAGAKFGWWHGAQARQALAYVEERSK